MNLSRSTSPNSPARLLVMACCAFTFALVPSAAKAATFLVGSQASFDAAIAKAQAGDTILLSPGRYPELFVRDRTFSSPVLISGSRDVLLTGLTFSNSSNFVLRGVSVTPPDGATNLSKIYVANYSRNITLDDILIDGRGEEGLPGAWLRMDATSANVTLQDSELTQCGRNRKCTDGGTGFRVLRNNFHDCGQCVFIKGGGSGVTIEDNVIRNAYPLPGCDSQTCEHLDLIYIMGGGPWTIERNSFGNCGPGDCTAQIYASMIGAPIHDVTIENNKFTGFANNGVWIASNGPPQNVRIVNNTILSGSPAVNLGLLWNNVPQDQRPLVVNNILGDSGRAVCDRSRHGSNLIVSGLACTGDVLGPANLDGELKPTQSSTLVIDRADATYAPPTDFLGQDRLPKPDRGAYEYIDSTSSNPHASGSGLSTRRAPVGATDSRGHGDAAPPLLRPRPTSVQTLQHRRA